MRLLATIAAWVILSGAAAAQTPQEGAAQTTPDVEPPEPAVTSGVEFDVLSKYLWRGIPYSRGKVLWSTAWVSTHGFTVTIFTNTDKQWSPHWNEFDFAAAYERSFGRVTLTGSYNLYSYYDNTLFDGSEAGTYRTSELIARAGVSAGPGEAFTTHAFDIQHFKGSYYAEAGYKVERDIDSKWTMSGDVSVAFWHKFAEKYFVPPIYDPIPPSAMGPLTVNAAVAYQLTRFLSVRPHLTLSRVLDKTTREAFDSFFQDESNSANSNGVVFGVAVTLSR
jgi:hypothetical protein